MLSANEATGSDEDLTVSLRKKHLKPKPVFSSSRPSSMLDKEEYHLDMIQENSASNKKLPGILIDYNQTI